MEKNLEQEFTFIINRKRMKKVPPKELFGFVLEDVQGIMMKDILIDRKAVPLAEENIGVRYRRLNNNFEFTYKKFLGRENGAAKYNEYTKAISEESFRLAEGGNFVIDKIPFLQEISTKGDLFIMLEILNRRKIYSYSSKKDKILVMLESIIYKNKHNTVSDVNLEVEVYINDLNNKSLKDFVKHIQKIYQGIPLYEGKNSRGLKLLEAKNAYSK